jgi:Glycosyl hydrolase family 79, N-terminal domain
VYKGFETKPLVLAPGGFFDASWFTELINKTKPSSLDVLTHHIYNLGPGMYISSRNYCYFGLCNGEQIVTKHINWT